MVDKVLSGNTQIGQVSPKFAVDFEDKFIMDFQKDSSTRIRECLTHQMEAQFTFGGITLQTRGDTREIINTSLGFYEKFIANLGTRAAAVCSMQICFLLYFYSRKELPKGFGGSSNATEEHRDAKKFREVPQKILKDLQTLIKIAKKHSGDTSDPQKLFSPIRKNLSRAFASVCEIDIQIRTSDPAQDGSEDQYKIFADLSKSLGSRLKAQKSLRNAINSLGRKNQKNEAFKNQWLRDLYMKTLERTTNKDNL